MDNAYQYAIASCLGLLNSYSAGTATYVLSCLCPEVFPVVLDLVRLDLSEPHQHKQLSENDNHPKPESYEELLSRFRVYTNMISDEDYPHFWLELTRSWLLSCPLDSDYEPDGEADQDSLCRRLHTELIESILRID